MKKLKALLITIAIAGAATYAYARSQVINASQEVSGNQHPGTASVKGPASITCITAVGTSATCYIQGPGVAQQIPKGGTVGTSGAGTVTLTCNGQGALRCSARITD